MAKNKPTKAWDWVVKEKKGNVNDYMDYVKSGEWKDTAVDDFTEADPVNAFMDEANAEEYTQPFSTNMSGGMEQVEVEELQAGLNLLGLLLKDVQPAPQIKVDGVLGPKTYNRWKQFYNLLPARTRNLLKYNDHPIVDLDDKDIEL